jgi:hypothetical protein
MKVCMNERMNDVCMSYYLNGNKHIKEKIYLLPKHILLLATFTQQHDTYIQVNDTKHMAKPRGNPI